jgi:hypothetical protein
MEKYIYATVKTLLEQEVLGKTNPLLSFDATWTE